MASPVPFKVFRKGAMIAAFKSPADAATFVFMAFMAGRGRASVKYNFKTVWGQRDGDPQSVAQVLDRIQAKRDQENKK